MKSHQFQFEYQVVHEASELNGSDNALLAEARNATKRAYAPYSRFYVGAAALLSNGQTVTGTNQENASYPVGICAERVLLGTVANMFPDASISTLAISYRSEELKSDHPISPCGMCRQALLEYEGRQHGPMRLLLAGQEGPVFVITTVKSLLPLAFTSEELL
jgi:cytidine deaminase